MGWFDDLFGRWKKKAAKEAGKVAAKQAAAQVRKRVEAVGEDFLEFAERKLEEGKTDADKREEALGVELPDTEVGDPDWVREAEQTEQRWSDRLSERELAALRGVEPGLGDKKRREREQAEESAKAQLAALKRQMGRDDDHGE